MSTVLRGEVYLLSTPLPGTPSGGEHLCVVASTPAYNSRTGYPVVCGIRRGTPKPYRIPIAPSEFVPQGKGRPLDGPRVVELGQSVGIAASDLRSVYGTVLPCVTDRLAKAVPRQFQLGGPSWIRRGEVWELKAAHAGVATVVLVQNDQTIQTEAQSQAVCLPYLTGCIDSPLMMVAKDQLKTKVRSLSATEQDQLDVMLRSILVP